MHAKLADDELKWAVIDSIRTNNKNIRSELKMKQIPDLEEFCEVMLEKTNGLVITFDHRTIPP